MTGDGAVGGLDVEVLPGRLALGGAFAFCLAMRSRSGRRSWTRSRVCRYCIQGVVALGRENYKVGGDGRR